MTEKMPEHVFKYPERVKAKVVLTPSKANFAPFEFRPKTSVELRKDALDFATKQYNAMSIVYDRHPTDENFDKLKRLYEFMQVRRAEYEEAIQPAPPEVTVKLAA